jgi:arsenate reductase
MLVTMGCGETCPHVPRVRRVEWDIADPKGQPPERVRAIRDDIRARVEQLIAAENWAAMTTSRRDERVSE